MEDSLDEVWSPHTRGDTIDTDCGRQSACCLDLTCWEQNDDWRKDVAVAVVQKWVPGCGAKQKV